MFNKGQIMKSLLILLILFTASLAADLNNALYRVIPVDYMHKVRRLPLSADTLSSLDMKACVGEYESGTFVVRAKNSISALNVTMTQFKNEGTGSVIPADSIQLRHIEYAFTNASHTSDIPLRLWPVKTLSLPSGENMQYWITLRSTGESDTGQFSGMAIIDGNGTVCSLSISFYVYPFKLMEFEDFACGAFVGSTRPINPATTRDMKAHNIDAVQFFWGYDTTWAEYYRSDTVRQIKNVNGHLQIEFHSMDSLLKFMKQAGMRGPVIPSIGNDSKAHMERDICMAFPQFQLDTTYDDNGKDTKIGPLNDPVFDTLLLSAVRQTKAKIESYGFEMVLLIYDEPTERLMEELADRYDLIHNAFPDLRTYGVTMNRLQWAQEVAPYAEILVANGSYQYIMNYANQQVKDYWFYSSNAGSREAGLCRGTYGLRWWKYNPGAVFFWAFNYYSTDPYIDYDGSGPESGKAVVFPPANHPDSLPIGTPAWEGLREAGDDWAYVKTLSKMLSISTGVVGNSIRTPFNQLSLKFQDNIFSTSGANDYTILDSVRTVVAGWILDLITDEPEKFWDIGIGIDKTVVSAENKASAGIEVSPNPFYGKVKIAFYGWTLAISNANVAIYSINGKLSGKLTASSQKLKAGISWNAAGNPPGVYIVKLTTGNKTYTRKLILLK
jgi:hypothetical protein